MRLAPITALMVAAMTASAAAQMFGPGMMMPGQMPPQQQQVPPCYNEFQPLKNEAEKRGKAIQAAASRKEKASREEICALFKSYSAAEGKMLGFIKANSQKCGIPGEAATQMTTNHARTLKQQNQICNVAAGPARPTGPGLSEALGTTRQGAGIDPTAPQSGTLDTLTGNVLSR